MAEMILRPMTGSEIAQAAKNLLCLAFLLLCAAPDAGAQFNFPVKPLGHITCVYSAVPNQVHSEDLAARVGDLRLDCTNDGIYNPQLGPNNNMAQYVLANFTVSLNTWVTGLDDGTATAAVLTTNRNDSYFPVANSEFPASDTCGIVGTAPSTPDPRYPCPQKGIQSGPNSVTWNGVKVPVPGAPNSLATLPTDTDADNIPDCADIFDQTSSNSCFDTTTSIRMTNIFANAAAVGARGAVFGNLTIFSGAGIAVNPSNQQTIANVFQGLFTDFGVVGNFQCVEGIRTLDIALEEGFAGAFKTLGDPTFLQGDFAGLSGYPLLELSSGFPPQQVGGTGGGVTQATRFKIRLFNVPEGVVPRFPNTVDEDATGIEGCPVEAAFGRQDLCLQRVEGADEDGAGGAAGDGVGDYEVPLVDGDGQVIYEVMNGDPFRPQDVIVPASFTCMPGSPTTTLQVAATFAPLSDGAVAPTGPVPRFVDTSGDPFSTGEVDLELVKTADFTVVTPGEDQVVFTLATTNHGPEVATDVDVVDIVPDGLTRVSNSVPCFRSSNIFTCGIGDLAVDETKVIQITTSVDADAVGTLVNQGSVTSGQPGPTPDPHPDMDTAEVQVLTDLVATALTGPTMATAGGMIDISVDVTNTGGLGAGPFEVGFVFSSDSSITPADPASTMTCSFPSGVASGATANCTGPIDVPVGLAPISYFLGAIADVTGVVVEHNEINNSRVSDSGPISMEAAACAADVVRANESLLGTQVIQATSTATLGPNLIIDGTDIVVNAPIVSILSGTSIQGMLSVGTTPSCP